MPTSSRYMFYWFPRLGVQQSQNAVNRLPTHTIVARTKSHKNRKINTGGPWWPLTSWALGILT